VDAEERLNSMDIEKLNRISEKVIGSAIEVHRNLGPGLLESVYEKALCIEFRQAGLLFRNQFIIPISYKGESIGEHRLDLLVEDSLVVELKAVDRFDPVFKAQLLSYLKMGNFKLGLLINFNVSLLKEGISKADAFG
jgi:GxxExxY protein